jgi:hypothetical protein
MDFSVKLAHLPADVAFPPRLNGKVRYEAKGCELVYSGFMTKCTYDELSALSDDVDYHRALERLFVLTSAATAEPSRRPFPAAAVAATIGAIALAAGAWWFTSRTFSADTTEPPTEVAAMTSVAR